LLADLEHIDEVANRTTLQVDELLDVARMQMDRPLDLDRSPTDLVALVRRAVGEHQQQTNRHTLTVDTDVPDLFGDWDPLRLSRALDQLLENAIKYSPNGGAIEVSVKRTNARGGAAEISVGDQGIGIPSDETDRIFDRFQRGSNAANRIAGTGLGLAGTRYIVESHGGTIRAHNRPGGGARFSIVLPLTSTPLAPDSST
jgi:signal transduction histidine kinase